MLSCRRTAKPSTGTACVVFRRDQLPMPGQERLRRHDRGYLFEATQSKVLRLLSKPSPLIIAKPQALPALQFPEHTNLLLEVVNDILLLPVDPARQRNHHESSDPHRGSLAECQPLH